MSALRHRRRLMKWQRYMVATGTRPAYGGWHDGMRRTHLRAIFAGRAVTSMGRCNIWYLPGTKTWRP